MGSTDLAVIVRSPVTSSSSSSSLSVRDQPFDFATGPDTGDDGDRHHPGRTARHTDGQRPGPDLVAQQYRSDVLVVQGEGFGRKDVAVGEVVGVAHAEPLPRGVVQIDDVALRIDNPDEIGRVGDVLQQQPRNIEFRLCVHPAPAPAMSRA